MFCISLIFMNSYIAYSVCVYNIKMLWDPVLLYCVPNMSVCLFVWVAAVVLLTHQTTTSLQDLAEQPR